MKKIYRRILVFILTAIFITVIVLSMIFLTPAPPAAEMDYARQCLSEAGKNNAVTYSSKLFNEAHTSYDSAMANWKRQNERFIFFRDYTRVLEFANLTAEKAIQATQSSKTNTSALKTRAEQKLDKLNRLVTEIDKLFNAYPLESETRNRISRGKMILEEAQINFARGQYLQANTMISEAESLLTSSFETASENLKNYFKSFDQWKSWADKTIRESKRTGGYSIIIDKFSRKLYVYQKGIKKMEFNAELGKNWVGDKRIKGDHATPEGMYKITKKFDSRKTKYYKALLLDYPNDEDLARFRSEISKGTLPGSAKIGGLIEIHGNGGRGIDWTEGCIALTDKEMDVIFRLISPGTPVTIVGSMIDLSRILNR
ncbi:MAG TPA: L,D-transpeptidase family protein [Bacteroidales bacterium]|nr:L,D-transpeptidase family protein [Bacteroidales bacterium]